MNIRAYLKIRCFRIVKKFLSYFIVITIGTFLLGPWLLKLYDYNKSFIQNRFYFFKEYFIPIHGKLLLIIAILIVIISLILKLIKNIDLRIINISKIIDRSHEIEKEIKVLNENKVVILTGGWGCGKTTLYKQFIQYKLEASFKFISHRFIYISCFGLKSADDLITQILNQTSSVEFLGIALRYFRQILESSTHFKRNLIPKQNYIVIDDFERLEDDSFYKEILGLIDFLVNQKCCQILIICNEDKIKPKVYEEFKEKVIDKTLKCPVSEELLSNIMQKEYPELFNNELVTDVQEVAGATYNLRCLSRALDDFKELNEEINHCIKSSLEKEDIPLFSLIWKKWQLVAFLMLYIKALNLLTDAQTAKSITDRIIDAMNDRAKQNQTGEQVMADAEKEIIARLFLILGNDFKYHNPNTNPPNHVPAWLKKYLEQSYFDWKEFCQDREILSICDQQISLNMACYEAIDLYNLVKGTINWIDNSYVDKNDGYVWRIYFLFLILQKITKKYDKVLALEALSHIGDNRLDEYHYQYLKENSSLAQSALSHFVSSVEERAEITAMVKQEINSMFAQVQAERSNED